MEMRLWVCVMSPPSLAPTWTFPLIQTSFSIYSSLRHNRSHNNHPRPHNNNKEAAAKTTKETTRVNKTNQPVRILPLPPLTGEYDWLIMRFLADNFEHHEHGSQWEGAELEAVDEHWLHNQCERHIQITGSADLSAHDLSASILRILSDRSSG